MDTATRQDWIIGYTRSGNPVYGIAGAEDGGSGDGGSGGDAGSDAGDGGDKGDSADKAVFHPIESREQFDRIMANAKKAMRDEYADYKDLKSKASEFDKLKEAQKSELEKTTDRLTQADSRATEAELRAMRLEVAIGKGLTPTQAKRLVGKSKEELEADADELLDSFKPNDDDGKRTTPSNRPKERLRGGGDPTEEVEENDPRKLAAKIDRL